MGPPPKSERRFNLKVLATALGLVAAVVAAIVVVALQSTSEPAPRPGVPADALMPAGTALPDGFTVPAGASLIATPMHYAAPYSGKSGESGAATPPCRAILLVADDPPATWTALLGQFESVLQAEFDPGTAQGCVLQDERLICGITRIGRSGPGDGLSVTAELQTVPGDVTGHYSVVLAGEHTSESYDSEAEPWPGGDAPAAPAARPRPGIGGPLAPQTLAEGTDPGDYVLLEGSELLVQCSAGSLTGGFGVLLRPTRLGRGLCRRGLRRAGPPVRRIHR